MKIYCYTNTYRSDLNDKTASFTYGEDIEFVEGYGNLLAKINDGDTAIFKDVTELDFSGSQDVQAIDDILNNYLRLLKFGADVMFDRSPGCDSDVIYQKVYEFASNGILSCDNEEAFKYLLTMQIESYINAKNAIALERKNVVKANSVLYSTNYGRPKGTKRESQKAKYAKNIILSYSKDFGGSKTENECIKMSGVSRNSYYLYKNTLLKDKK